MKIPARSGTDWAWVRVDADWYGRAMSHKWRLDSAGYAVTTVWDTVTKKATHLSMHRMVVNAPAGWLIDHRLGNTLDNRRCMLRLATHSQNTANRRKLLRCKSSKYRGVTKHKGGRWQAAAKHRDKCIHGGLHDTQEQAAAAYNAIARRIWGRFSVLNRIPKKAAAA